MQDSELINLEAIFKSIRPLRLHRDMTQEDLAHRCGLSRQMVDRIKNHGPKNIRLITLGKITMGLGISLSKLIMIGEKESCS